MRDIVSEVRIPPFIGPQAAEITRRLAEPRRFILVVAGARQVGKTTLVRQVAASLKVPVRCVR